jgi:hypothetical protein
MPDDPNRFLEAGAVRIAQSVREMKCYTITDGELNNLSLANTLFAVSCSLAAACFGFAMDITKDIALAGQLTPAGEVLAHVVRPTAWWGTGIFTAIALLMLRWRHNAIAIIKKESGDS